MTSSAPTELRKTPLHAVHLASGARMVEFGGWDMPVEYSGITDEHLAVRTRAGLFDVSHMGQIEVAGADALALVQWLTTNDASRLAIGQAQYSALTTPDGTFVDDVLVYRLADEHYLLVVNAGNIIKACDGSQSTPLRRRRRRGRQRQLAVRADCGAGARSGEHPADADGRRPVGIKYYWFATGEVAAVRATISRTGYTGEDGFEILRAAGQAERVWDALLDAGQASTSARAASARATRCASKRACDCAAATWTSDTTRARGRPRLDRRLEEGRLPRATRPLRAQKAGGARRGSWSRSR